MGNLLIHREYTNAFPAKIIIKKSRVLAENWNRPHYGGVIDPANFSLYPKNPVIAKFFKEIGRVDELGSGVRYTFKYCSIYTTGTKPELIEEDIFKATIPLMATKTGKANPKSDWEKGSEKILRLIFLDKRISAVAMADRLGISERAVEKQLARMKRKGVIERHGPDKGGYWKICI